MAVKRLKPPPEGIEAYSFAILAMLDAKARERQYDSILTGITYRDDANGQFAAEGEALFNWRSAVWAYAVTELDKVQSGNRTQPTVTSFINEIEIECPFSWP